MVPGGAVVELGLAAALEQRILDLSNRCTVAERGTQRGTQRVRESHGSDSDEPVSAGVSVALSLCPFISSEQMHMFLRQVSGCERYMPD